MIIKTIMYSLIILVILIETIYWIERINENIKFNKGICKKCSGRYILRKTTPRCYEYVCPQCKKRMFIHNKSLNKRFLKRENELKLSKENRGSKEIFIITALENIPDRRGICQHKLSLAWYGGNNVNNLLKDLNSNSYVINTDIFKYVIAEKITEGLNPLASQRVWYKFIYNTWVEIEEPYVCNTNLGYGMG